jgi:hypothetical protein
LRTQALALIFAAITCIGLITGILYYNSLAGPQTPGTPVPSFSPSPATSAVPSASPSSFASSSSPTFPPTPASYPWVITNLTGVAIESTLSSMGLQGSYTYYPNRSDNTFLVASFWLQAESGALALAVQEILVIVDSTYSFSPVGEGVGGGSMGTGAVGDLMMGNITRGFSGVTTFKGYTVVVEAVSLKPSGMTTSSYSSYIEQGVSPPFRFAYVLPKEYVNGTHDLKLKIAGSTQAIDLAIKTP